MVAEPVATLAPGPRHALWSAAVGCVAFGLFVITAGDIGVAWDEPAYMAAAESYMAWFRILFETPAQAFHPEIIARQWSANPEHPPLGKIWQGVWWLGARQFAGDLAAHRLGNMILAAALLGMVYDFAARTHGHLAGIFAASALLAMPRFFFHAHLAALDVPAVAVSLALAMAFVRWVDNAEPARDVLLGILFGIGLAVKINIGMTFVGLALWTAIYHRRRNMIRRFVTMAVVAGGVFVASWPYLYDETVRRLWYYVRFVTTHHWDIPQYYLGQLYMPPPWHFPFVMLVATVPLSVLAAGAGGISWLTAGATRRREAVFHAIMILFPLLILGFAAGRVYDNDRLFIGVLPYIAVCAGVGCTAIYARVGPLVDKITDVRTATIRRGIRTALALLLLSALVAPAAWGARSVYPYLLAYYSETVGGPPGAQKLGLESIYWAATYELALPELNESARDGDVVWAQDHSHDVLHYLQMQGRLKKSVRVAWAHGATSVYSPKGVAGAPFPISDADWVLLQYRQSGIDRTVLDWIKTRKPVLRLVRDGVTLFELYRRK